MGTLKLRDAQGNIVWSREGNQGDDWKYAESTSLGSSQNFTFEGIPNLEGPSKGSFGDVAMDAISVICAP